MYRMFKNLCLTMRLSNLANITQEEIGVCVCVSYASLFSFLRYTSHRYITVDFETVNCWLQTVFILDFFFFFFYNLVLICK